MQSNDIFTFTYAASTASMDCSSSNCTTNTIIIFVIGAFVCVAFAAAVSRITLFYCQFSKTLEPSSEEAQPLTIHSIIRAQPTACSSPSVAPFGCAIRIYLRHSAKIEGRWLFLFCLLFFFLTTKMARQGETDCIPVI